jgi:PIN domain nuclease of toxin-antitoxin system
MRVLLDTHTFLWAIEDSPELSSTAYSVLSDSDNRLYLSIASVWELAIKASARKLTVKQPFETAINDQLRLLEVELLGIEVSHIAFTITLPMHHRDPFDRILIAQSMVERMPILSRDTAFDAYDNVQRLW